MKSFPLLISSPDGDLYRGDAVMLVLRTPNGEMAVMAGHIPLLATVIPCECRIRMEDDSVKTGRIGEGGLLTVDKDRVTLLSGSFSFTGGEAPSVGE